MSSKPTRLNAKILLSYELTKDMIDESIRILGKIKSIDPLHNEGIVILQDNKTVLFINTTLLTTTKDKKLNIGQWYHLLGEYRNYNQYTKNQKDKEKQNCMILYIRIARELTFNFDLKKYLKCLQIMRGST